ncbi:hypothetical protein EMIT0P74_150130 [Pseudomonas sp. IT-P74]
MAGETEDNGARTVDIHGARAYHQTCFSGVVAVCLVDTLWWGDLPPRHGDFFAIDNRSVVSLKCPS